MKNRNFYPALGGGRGWGGVGLVRVYKYRKGGARTTLTMGINSFETILMWYRDPPNYSTTVHTPLKRIHLK
jgi:hypothetical protein